MSADPAPMPDAVGPVRQQKLTDQAYDELLQLIASGSLPEGSRLPTERDLCDRLSVSRPVVREALSRLRADGLIVSRQGSGSFVQRRPDKTILSFAPIGSISHLLRCLDFRIALEGEAASLAATQHGEEELSAIGAALERLDEAIRTGAVAADGDFALHLAIAEATRNAYFVTVMLSLRPHISFGIELARTLSLQKPARRLAVVQGEHYAIHRAIAARDATAAREAMRTHLAYARDRILGGEPS